MPVNNNTTHKIIKQCLYISINNYCLENDMKIGMKGICAGLLVVWAGGAKASVEDHCDMGGEVTKSVTVNSGEDCEKTCDQDPDCKGFSFVSGWNKCFLKSKAGGAHKITFISQTIEMRGQERVLGEKKVDFDHSGKDLRKVSPVQDEDQCGKECNSEKECKGYVYIKGYRDCWLKKTEGKFKAKIFYCGSKVK